MEGRGQPRPSVRRLRAGQDRRQGRRRNRTEAIAGGMEMNPMVPTEVPSYWAVYFNVDDVDKTFKKATEAGGQEMLAPQDFPGGRFAILSDPQGAAFGLLKMKPTQK